MPQMCNDSQRKRPILVIPYSSFEKIIEISGIVGVLLNVVILVKYWSIIPNIIPTHFGFSGEVDAVGSKGTLLMLPIIIFVLYMLITILSRVPHVFNYISNITEQNAKAQYQNARTLLICVKVEIVYTFTFIQWRIIEVTLGRAKGLGIGFLPIFIFILLGTVIYFIRCSMKFR